MVFMLWLHFNEKEKVVDWGMFTLQVFALTTIFKASLLCQQPSNLFIFYESKKLVIKTIMRKCSIALKIILKVIVVQINDGYGDIYSS